VVELRADSIRVDKWLWAARFFKTRAVAAQAVTGGKVKVNGERAKAARAIRPGDELRVRVGPYEHVVRVVGLAERRGPARDAVQLYEESADSKIARETLAAQLRADRVSFLPARERPSKHARRALIRLKKSDKC
jgi:ribosome-associated heat shock protein Hsp15